MMTKQTDDAMFTCRKCEANYSVEQPTTECPVCGWKRRGERKKSQTEIDMFNRECAGQYYCERNS